MSRARGVFPLFLATTFGIVNGLWVFGPAFKEQQQEKELQAKQGLTVSGQTEIARAEGLPNAEAAASRDPTTDSTLKAVETSTSWWTKFNVWNRPLNDTTKKDVAPTEGSKPTKGAP